MVLIDGIIFVLVGAGLLWACWYVVEKRETERAKTIWEAYDKRKAERGWDELLKRTRNGDVARLGLFGGGGVLAEIENDLGLNGELFDEVEYRLGLRDIDSEYVVGNGDEGERKVIDAYSDYMDKWGQGR